MQLQCSPIADRLLKAVATHIAFVIFFCTEGIKGIAIGPVNRGSRQTEQKSIGQRLAHFPTKITFLSAMSFINQRDNITTIIQAPGGLAKLEDGSDDNLAYILRQQLL